MNPLIVLNNITKSYKEQSHEVCPLRGFSISVREGEFAAITGKSGCGKTTLLNILGCLDRPDTGKYYFGGKEVSGFSARKLAAFRRNNIGFIFQGCNLLPNLTARQNVELALRFKRVEKSKIPLFADAALSAVEMRQFADFYPDCLSGGQQQRVAAARAFACSPRVLLADEPTGNLDTQNAAALIGLFRRLQSRGATIIMITHSPEQAAMADSVINLSGITSAAAE